jgi:hypothetical protein
VVGSSPGSGAADLETGPFAFRGGSHVHDSPNKPGDDVPDDDRIEGSAGDPVLTNPDGTPKQTGDPAPG